MCGIFLAIANSKVGVYRKFIDNMFVLDSLRGKDSCGLLTVSDKSKPSVFKRAVSAMDFIDLDSYNNEFKGDKKIAVGHNRSATKGKVSSCNAHPFTVGDVSLVHNGTLRGQWRLPDNKDYEVDSENVAHAIDKLGIEEAWPLVDGAAALVWWNDEDKSINLIRNRERSFYFTITKSGDIYGASEYYMLAAALDRNNIVWIDIQELPTNTLHTFKKGKLTLKEIDGFVAPAYTTTYVRGRTNWYDKGDYYKTTPPNPLIKFTLLAVSAGKKYDTYYLEGVGDTIKYYTILDYRKNLNLNTEEVYEGRWSYTSQGEVYLSGSSVKKVKKQAVVDLRDKKPETEESKATCDWCDADITNATTWYVDESGSVFCEACNNADTKVLAIGEMEAVSV